MSRSVLRFLRGNTIALLALFIALGGTTYAATALPKNSVGTKQLRKNAVTNPKIKANAVTGAKVKNDSLTGADILESSLGTVPSATHATTADSATNATNATNATHATSATTATTATSATNAANATKVNGRNVGCAAGTVQFLGQCFETALRPATDIFTASDTCKAAGGYLGNVMELRSGRGGHPLTLAAGGEWAGHVDADSTDGNRGTTIANSGGFSETGTLSSIPYRCVLPLVGGPGTTAPTKAGPVAHSATASDGS